MKYYQKIINTLLLGIGCYSALSSAQTTSMVDGQKLYSCPDGQILDTNQCKTVNYSCQDSSFTYDASQKKCVKNIQQISGYQCPSGYIKEGTTCKKKTLLNCDVGFNFNQRTKVCEQTVFDDCGPGYSQSTDRKTCQRTDKVCPNGYSLSGSTCSKRITDSPQCPSGSFAYNGKCAVKHSKTCPKGTYQQGTQCLGLNKYALKFTTKKNCVFSVKITPPTKSELCQTRYRGKRYVRWFGGLILGAGSSFNEREKYDLEHVAKQINRDVPERYRVDVSYDSHDRIYKIFGWSDGKIQAKTCQSGHHSYDNNNCVSYTSKVCRSGYTLSGSSCHQTLTESATNVNRSIAAHSRLLTRPQPFKLNTLPANATYQQVQTIGQLKETAKYQPANNDYNKIAAFRYLDIIYQLDAQSGDIINRLTHGQARALLKESYADKERTSVRRAEVLLREAIAKGQEVTKNQQFLLDLYHNRALLELLVAQQDRRDAQESRFNQENAYAEAKYLSDAIEKLQHALDEYWVLFEHDANLFRQSVPHRAQFVPQLFDDHANPLTYPEQGQLAKGYRDLKLLYQMMHILAQTQLDQARLLAGQQDATTELYQKVTALSKALKEKHATLENLFHDVDLHQLAERTQIPHLIDQLWLVLNELDLSESWLVGEQNILGISNDALLLTQNYSTQGKASYDSFNAIKTYITSEGGALAQARYSFQKAASSFEHKNIFQQRVKDTFHDRKHLYQEKLNELLGWAPTSNCYDLSCANLPDHGEAGSRLSIQFNQLEQAQLSQERKIQELDNLITSIELEAKRVQGLLAIDSQRSELILDYGHKQADISSQIGQIRADAAKARHRGGIIGGMLNAIASFALGSPLSGITSLTGAANNAITGNAEIKAIRSESKLRALSQKLAAEERAVLLGLDNSAIQMNSQIQLKQSWLRAHTLVYEIAISQKEFVSSLESYVHILNESFRQLDLYKQSHQQLASSYFADPVHVTSMNFAVERAVEDFTVAQEWLFYLARALEYKWQKNLEEALFNFKPEQVFSMRNIDELNQFYSKLIHLDGKNNLSTQALTSEREDRLSLKEDVLGYVQVYDTDGTEIAAYADPNMINGDQGMMTAQAAFHEKLAMLRHPKLPQYLSFEFSSTTPAKDSGLFVGPEILQGMGDHACIVAAGEYNDKIETVAVDIVNEQHHYHKPELRGFLTYGGQSLFRTQKPGEVTEAGIDHEFLRFIPKFWDITMGSFSQEFRTSIRARIAANTPLKPTVAFKERSVAATQWRLSVDIGTDSLPKIAIEDIDDIQLVIKHRSRSRNFSQCYAGDGEEIKLR